MRIFAVGLRGAVALTAAVVPLAFGCGSSNKTTPQPDLQDETPVACDAGCDVGVCNPDTGKCVECLADADCQSSESCIKSVCIEKAPEPVVTVCSPGVSRCSADRSAVLTCAADGSEETSEACAPDAPCTARSGSALCADWTCSPNSFSCDGNTLLLCSDDGTEKTPFHTCDADQYCDARRAVCVNQICTPGEKSCDGATLQVCNEDGSEQTADTTCGLSEECTPTGCVPLVCEPNATFCQDGKAWQCSASATSAAVVDDCAKADKYCQEHEGQASCSDQVCFPGDALCVDGVATTCKPDGSGPKPGGEKCADSGEVCFAGQCRDQVCTPGQKVCDHDALYLCAENGTDTTLYKTCNYNEFCEGASASCKARVCTPGLPGCFGTIKATCKDDGSGYDAGLVDCADSGKVCDTGSCVPKVCEPYKVSCLGNAPAYCNGSGSAQSVYQSCYQGSFCQNGQCWSQVCVPGEAACDGNLVSVCSADGSGALPGDAADDCATQGKACVDGACKPKVCEPDAKFCDSGSVQQCSANGASFTRSQYCTSETYCKTLSATEAQCEPKLCVSGAVSCVGGAYGTCSSDGVTLEDGFDDCKGKGQVCSLDGCDVSAVDELGGTSDIESLSSGVVAYDRIHVTEARKLTQIAAYLSLPSTRTLRWTVYQPSGWYDWQLIFDQVTTASGAQYHSSNPMELELEADKDYLVGVAVTGGSFASYLTRDAYNLDVLSFGSAFGSGSATYASSISYYPASGTMRAMRLTTELP